MKLVVKAAEFQLVAIVFLFLLFATARSVAGSFFFKPSSTSQRTENVYSAQQFQFVITKTNFPQLPSISGSGRSLLLNFAMAPVDLESLQALGAQYTGYTSVTAEDIAGSGVRAPRIICRSNFVLSRDSFFFGVSSGELPELEGMSGRVMPLWGLADFVLEPYVRNQLMARGFTHPCAIMEPTLLGKQAIYSDFLGAFQGAPVISRYFFFGNNPQVIEQYSVSVQSEPVKAIHPPLAPAPLPLEKRSQQSNVVVQSNIGNLVRALAPGSFFFVVGLTRSGKWGFLALVYGQWYLEAVRRELWESLSNGKKDFDSDSSGGDASGSASTRVR